MLPWLTVRPIDSSSSKVKAYSLGMENLNFYWDVAYYRSTTK